MKKKKKRVSVEKSSFLQFMVYVVIIIFLIVVGIGLWNKFSSMRVGGGDLEGELGESKIGVSVSLKNSPPNILSWEKPLENGNPPLPVENGLKNVKFNVSVSDGNGYRDITDPAASITARFVNTNNGAIPSEQERNSAGKCVVVETSPPRTAKFLCSVDMQYWDEPGSDNWIIEITAVDVNGGSITKSSVLGDSNYPFFSYGSLLGMSVDKSFISWPAVDVDSKNIGSSDNPVVVRNTGNVPVTASGNSWIKITSRDLVGENSSNIMNSSSFGVNEINDCLNNLDILDDSSPVQINGASYSRRPGDDPSGAGKRELYFCIGNQINPYPLPEDSYATPSGNEWLITASQ